jgi:ABC-type polysaccharide transport system permease subunit
MEVIFISAVSLVADESSMVKSPFVGLGKNFTLTSPAFFSVQSVTILTEIESVVAQPFTPVILYVVFNNFTGIP